MRFPKIPPKAISRSRLIRFALKTIEAEVRRTKKEREQGVPVGERGVPETPPQEEVTRLGEDILYFDLPDEVLKVEERSPILKPPRPSRKWSRRSSGSASGELCAPCPKSGSTPWYCATRSVSVVRSSHGLSESRETEVEHMIERARETASQGAVGGRLYFARARRSNESDRSSSRRSR